MQAAFPDGILWATLGQTPDLTVRLREWIEKLGGIVGQTAPTLDDLTNTLAEALVDKACLLIVDDAWRKAHLEQFCAGGSPCRLLITTRNADVAQGLGPPLRVPVMGAAEASRSARQCGLAVDLQHRSLKPRLQIVRRLGFPAPSHANWLAPNCSVQGSKNMVGQL